MTWEESDLIQIGVTNMFFSRAKALEEIENNDKKIVGDLLLAFGRQQNTWELFAFRLNAGKVSRHTMARLASLVQACAGKRTTYEKVTNGKTWFDAEAR
jgi:hypothetical protein